MRLTSMSQRALDPDDMTIVGVLVLAAAVIGLLVRFAMAVAS